MKVNQQLLSQLKALPEDQKNLVLDAVGPSQNSPDTTDGAGQSNANARNTNKVQLSPMTQPTWAEGYLSIGQLTLPYLLIIVGMGFVTYLVFHMNTGNQAYMTVGISTIVGLIGFLVGHTSASASNDKSEQRIMEAMRNGASVQPTQTPPQGGG
jgi:hypothetical protein